MLDSFKARADELKAAIIADRRYLHAHAEVGANLYETTAYITKRLDEMGIEWQEITKCCIVANVGNKKGKTILLRADTDALPQKELSGLPFACETGATHSCGHDIHTATVLAAAQMLKEQEANLKGNVKILFQPDEEGINGAFDAINAGVLRNPTVNACLGVHTSIPLEPGHFKSVSGPLLASSDLFKIEIEGRAAHGAMPHLSRDPIVASAYIVLACENIIAREIDQQETAVLTIGKLESGQVANVIPQNAVIEGSIRAFTDEMRSFIKQRLAEICSSVSGLTRTVCKVDFLNETPPTSNNAEMSKEMFGYLEDVVGAKAVNRDEKPLMAADDFAYFCDVVPSFMFHTGMGDGKSADGNYYALHNPNTIFSEKGLPVTAAALAYCCAKWLENHSK